MRKDCGHKLIDPDCNECWKRRVEALQAERDRHEKESKLWEEKYLSMLTQRNYAQAEISRLKAEVELAKKDQK